jgi:DNA polymerase (family 10)
MQSFSIKEAILDLLDEIIFCLECQSESIFKIKAYQKARKVVAETMELQAIIDKKQLITLPGIGSSIAQVIEEFVEKKHSIYLDELKKSFPEGFFELIQLKGVGPKTALKLIDTLRVRSILELQELLEKKDVSIQGFKEQQISNLKLAIKTFRERASYFLISEAYPLAQTLLHGLKEKFPDLRIELTHNLRRCIEVVQEIVFLVGSRVSSSELMDALYAAIGETIIPVKYIIVPLEDFEWMWFKTTGSEAFVKSFDRVGSFETDIFASKGLPWIEPRLRESSDFKQILSARIIETESIRGFFHVHTTFSDGRNTLSEMIEAAFLQGYEYVGISDHSQSAKYAQGLSVNDIFEQKRQIQMLAQKYLNKKIFFGIESDILIDGCLDYEPQILKEFDFVIASIHSRFEMAEEAMTDRLVKAIQNPFTRFLGHPTGRLLIKRPGYAVDMATLVKESAKHDVAMEFNVSAERLDFDWRLGHLLIQEQCLVAINPDAHSVNGYDVMEVGVWMAQKSLIPTEQFINTKPIEWVEQWLHRK